MSASKSIKFNLDHMGLHHTLKNVTYSLKKQKGQTLDYVNMMKKGY